ncbi:hypothetical protein METBIDRAFT_30757 [Metschnikowia bicuspidata var. bicuspidata NRRL YB-4993]|uniref:STB6-like N-terminal domain-containing protein n=1 Tax=Metschnikowia bicuspidata var. bicuspidata NRRL YB-4993 TaxID=869754 RepID=A0A1A0HKF5_9ASCO|nr:hypothetical protein METBIDRAFT_30757 [Metschnikowia bicuspidata var. bicuspidata NRRL YB-4993]OBA24505.1 hypothetical protein METBIDRAFT_30757 [Metschnikowia bicuspidata var. bicuspidata NRRL YB-4993]
MSASKNVSNLGGTSHDQLIQRISKDLGDIGPNVPSKRMGSHEAVFSTSKDLITYIFPDFKAVDYFRRDFVSLNEFHILEKTEANGFEIYLVDQWIRDRKIGSVASVFTGNSHSKVKVCKFTTTKKQSRNYPPRFQEYLNELLLNHATFKRMDLVPNANPSNSSVVEDGSDIAAYLLVTNISAMPHNLFLIPIPEGDVRAVGHRYMVNSNLKKLKCGGRSLSLLAEKVSDASEDKFRQMYCILNESVPIQFAILELVNIIQTCLFYFDLLDAKYADGLLCHKTEDAIKNWWNLVGLPHFNSKPNHKSGVLCSKTVAAIISLTVSVKLRLQLIGGCDVPKDPFEAESFLISIGHFQKQVKIEKRRKLNLLTLSRLFYYTNQNALSEKSKSFYSPFGNELSFDDTELATFFDQSYVSPSGAKNNSSASLPGQAASAYRRNKIYYSKELKKLTNVVKNTVQDHIMVKEDQDDLYADTSLTKPTTKLRNKIGFKLSDNLVPADIETTDIELFSKKCIVGKVLQRLWVGLSPSDVKLAIGQVSGEKEPNSSFISGDNDGYTFLSFCDAFSANQDLHQVADKSGRLGRMKLTFQSRKTTTKSDTNESQANEFQNPPARHETYGSLLDSELRKLSDSLSPLEMNTDTNCNSSDIVAEKRDISSLSRRNSYPFVKSFGESNLRTITATQPDGHGLRAHNRYSKRAVSFSILEDFFNDFSTSISHERTRMDYLSEVSRAILLENLRKGCENTLSTEVAPKEKLINLELQKILNSHSIMVHRKLRFESEYGAVLDIRMKDLADNLDKMAFRSRDLLKKIDELDEHLEIFESKLHSESMTKLDSIINRVLHSAKFDCVFEDRDEKLQIVKSLTGADQLHDEEKFSSKSSLCIRQFIVFLYQIALMILQLFHFDRSKMNLDRIRGQYRKLDPNRKYIRKIYKIIEREPQDGAPSQFSSDNSEEAA